MSGHNKWSKIKHKKAATDSQKSKLFSKHSMFITMESRKCNGNISSPGLAAMIDRAKKDSMPKENIDRAVAKGAGATGAHLQEVIFEAYGPGGVAMIIVAVTDNNNRTAPLIRHVFTKANLSLGAPGTSMWAFSKTADGYSPNNPTDISDEDGESLAELIEALEEQEDVTDIYTSADTIDSV